MNGSSRCERILPSIYFHILLAGFVSSRMTILKFYNGQVVLLNGRHTHTTAEGGKGTIGNFGVFLGDNNEVAIE